MVEVSEPEQRDTTKQVSRTRKLLRAVNVATELRLFACDCSERALLREREQGREPDERRWRAIETSRAFARGEATIEELSTAYDAASIAASIAASSAALSAAYRAGGRAVGRAAYIAEREWQRQRFDELVTSKLEAMAV